MHAHWKSIAIVCILLIAATVAAYSSVLSYDFISLDDADYVYRNRHVLAGLSWSGWCYAWTSFECSNWHPLTWLSLELDGSIGGSTPVAYHATSLILHTMNSVILFLVTFQLTNCFYRSACVAALFALHPLHVESVAWVSERKDVLSTLFLLLTISAYVRYASRPSVLGYLPVMALLTLGLLAKPMLVTLPILLLLLDAWPMGRIAWNRPPTSDARFPQRSLRALFIEKIPLLGLAFADGLTTVVAQYGPVKLMVDVTFDTRIANMFNAYLWYLKKTFIPTNLTVFYPHPERDVPWMLVGIGVIVFSVISAYVLRRRESPHLLFGWAWFVISLLPVIGLIQVGCQAYADRYVYIPHIGLFISIIWELHAWVASLKFGRVIGGTMVLAALIGCGLLTRIQTGYWKNNDALWSRAIEINPNNGFAHAHLADVRLAEKDYERAIFHIESGLRIRRSGYVANALSNWGKCLIELNRPAEAEQKFLAALKVDHNHEGSLEELAKLLRKQGRLAEAKQVAAQQAAIIERRAEKLPDTAATQFRLGYLKAQQGNPKQALVHFEQAVQLAPQSAEAHINLAMTQMQLKLGKEARANLTRALELKPELAMAHFCMAKLLETENDIPGAKKHLEEAIRINPNDVDVKRHLDRLSKQ